ncbi:hypothetical protein DFJ43DRAFT_1092472 [Lentinula guzmanii]|uniref:Uncharacterized protein n=1 Tax=Lentinula guzmanii TaxID=2804957 RepID=A0AA38MXB9_9AGAR|nr:hypothetical protein DFJ43DRAFT_1092472 [Lentinula guzmanii]
MNLSILGVLPTLVASLASLCSAIPMPGSQISHLISQATQHAPSQSRVGSSQARINVCFFAMHNANKYEKYKTERNFDFGDWEHAELSDQLRDENFNLGTTHPELLYDPKFICFLSPKAAAEDAAHEREHSQGEFWLCLLNADEGHLGKIEKLNDVGTDKDNVIEHLGGAMFIDSAIVKAKLDARVACSPKEQMLKRKEIKWDKLSGA